MCFVSELYHFSNFYTISMNYVYNKKKEREKITCVFVSVLPWTYFLIWASTAPTSHPASVLRNWGAGSGTSRPLPSGQGLVGGRGMDGSTAEATETQWNQEQKDSPRAQCRRAGEGATGRKSCWGLRGRREAHSELPRRCKPNWAWSHIMSESRFVESRQRNRANNSQEGMRSYVNRC